RARPGLRTRCRAGAGAGRQRHPARPAPHVARTQRGNLPLADRRSGPSRLLLLRRPDHHRPALLRVPLARRLSAGPYAPRPAAVQELIDPPQAFCPGLTRFDTAGRRWLQSRRLAKPVIERIAGAADGADWIGIVTAVERLAQPADMDVDGALVDIDFAAPHPVEKLLAREHATGPLHQKFEQPIFGWAEIDRAAGARDALLLAINLEVAEGQHVGKPLGQRAPQ